ncbi:MAG: hypothetical protein ABH954_05880 [Candidatus Omnitrophota bacterium]
MDSLTITIIFIILSTVIGAFIKGRMRDKCLLDFEGNLVNLELKDCKVIWGNLRLEATGLELQYKEPYLDQKDNHIENSFVLYKNEYQNIQCVVRFVDDLDDKSRKKREKKLKSIIQRKGLRSLARRIRNLFATVRDSIMEVANLLLGKMKQATPAGRVLAGQDKYVTQMQQGVSSTFNTSFEPLLEKHLGRKVVLELSKEDKIIEYPGILKGYTAEFLEIMDLDYSLPGKEKHKADIAVPRSIGTIRHLGE